MRWSLVERRRYVCKGDRLYLHDFIRFSCSTKIVLEMCL